MPTLKPKGKQIVAVHHLTAPSRTLRVDANGARMKAWIDDKKPVDGDRAERIAKQAGRKGKTAVVFAVHKFMGQKKLSGMGVVFCQLPYCVNG